MSAVQSLRADAVLDERQLPQSGKAEDAVALATTHFYVRYHPLLVATGRLLRRSTRSNSCMLTTDI